MLNIKRLAFLMFALALTPGNSMGKEVRVAVASNFLTPLRMIAPSFEAASGHTILIISASTGKLYAQITHGAPFDVFLAADSRRPELLEKKGIAVGNKRFTYAIGQLAFWAPSASQSDGSPCHAVLTKAAIKRLAIANPTTAPYGMAAEAVLRHEKLWQAMQPRIVQGENIGQTLQYLITRNADAGFVAVSQLKDPLLHRTGCIWNVPEAFHLPLKQQAVLLKSGEKNAAALAFLDFLHSPEAKNIIQDMGYNLP